MKVMNVPSSTPNSIRVEIILHFHLQLSTTTSFLRTQRGNYFFSSSSLRTFHRLHIPVLVRESQEYKLSWKGFICFCNLCS